MGKSQETYSKKEKEKKRLKKRQDKEEKKEERKFSNNKGKGFDNMIGYVDEYGMLASAPPDPTAKKIEVNLEDIQLGAARRDIEPQELERKGVVSFFNDSKGYGFIRDLKTQQSVFVHANGIAQPIKENDKVTFEVEMGQKGPMAVRVQIVK